MFLSLSSSNITVVCTNKHCQHSFRGFSFLISVWLIVEILYKVLICANNNTYFRSFVWQRGQFICYNQFSTVNTSCFKSCSFTHSVCLQVLVEIYCMCKQNSLKPCVAPEAVALWEM